MPLPGGTALEGRDRGAHAQAGRGASGEASGVRTRGNSQSSATGRNMSSGGFKTTRVGAIQFVGMFWELFAAASDHVIQALDRLMAELPFFMTSQFCNQYSRAR